MEDLVFTLYFLFIIVAIIFSIVHYRKISHADKFISWLLFITLITEVIIALELFKAHNLVYNIFNPVQFLLFCGYFHNCIPFLKRKNAGVWLGILGICITIFTLTLLDSFKQLNYFFLLFEAFCIDILCLLAFYHLLMKDDEIPLRKNAHFWITSIWFVFWSFTFVHWGMQKVFNKHLMIDMHIPLYFHWGINLLTYLGLAIVFIRYHKLIPSGD